MVSDRKKLWTKGTIKTLLYITTVAVAISYFNQEYSGLYYFGTLSVVFYTAYNLVSKDRSPDLILLFINIVFVQISTYLFLSSQIWWTRFFGVEVIGSMAVGLVFTVVSNLLAVLIIGSIIFGDLKTYSKEMERRQRERHEDPFGDDHAQDILNNTGE